jgi:hypothetical protein
MELAVDAIRCKKLVPYTSICMFWGLIFSVVKDAYTW